MAKLSIILVQLFLSVIFFTGITYAQSGKEAFKALKKLEAKVEIGISYQKYRETLGDTNADVKLFLESNEAGNSPELSRSISKVMLNYKDAADLWGQYIESRGKLDFYDLDNPHEARQFYPDLIDSYQRILKKYPKAYDKVIVRPEMVHKRIINLNDILQVIWSEASKELKKASNYLQE